MLGYGTLDRRSINIDVIDGVAIFFQLSWYFRRKHIIFVRVIGSCFCWAFYSQYENKGRTIRKLIGRGGFADEVQKKYAGKGKLNIRKFMHAN